MKLIKRKESKEDLIPNLRISVYNKYYLGRKSCRRDPSSNHLRPENLVESQLDNKNGKLPKFL